MAWKNIFLLLNLHLFHYWLTHPVTFFFFFTLQLLQGFQNHGIKGIPTIKRCVNKQYIA